MKADFLQEATTCLYQKFDWLANLTLRSSSADAAYQSRNLGRTLLSLKDQLKYEPNNPSAGSKIHMLYKSANVMHESVMQKMFGGNLFDMNKEQRELKQQLKQIDFNGMLENFLRSLTQGFSKLNELAAVYKALKYETNAAQVDLSQLYNTFFTGQPRQNSTGPGIIDRLGEIGDCLNSVSEEELEDGLTWVRCLYTCE